MYLFIALGILVITLFTFSLMYFIRSNMTPELKRSCGAAYKNRSHLLHKLAKGFIVVSLILSCLTMLQNLYLSSVMISQSEYQAALEKGARVMGTVVSTQKAWYSCIGKPSICAQKISVVNSSGNIVISNYFLDYGFESYPGQSIKLVRIGERYFPEHLPPLSNDSSLRQNTQVLLLIFGLFFYIGSMLKGCFYWLSRD